MTSTLSNKKFASRLGGLRLWLIQFFGNAVIMLAIAWWLNLGDAHWWQLLFAAVLAIVIVVSIAVLHGGTLNYLFDSRDEPGAPNGSTQAGFRPPFMRALKHALAFALWAFIFFHLWQRIDGLSDYQYQATGYLRSGFPEWLRKLVSENRMRDLYSLGIFILRWVVLPGVLLPFALLCSDRGFRGFLSIRVWFRMLKQRRLWAAIALASVVGVVLPAALAGWRLNAKTTSATGEGIFVAFRLLLAYLLALFTWLMLGSMLARARRRADENLG
ncbi:MAG TPA: hypothetical protein VKZ53_29270 [Candidatus Angelobacter sp.]|nr:hypothetical protein [Candidatus Angelobacter sp.]